MTSPVRRLHTLFRAALPAVALVLVLTPPTRATAQEDNPFARPVSGGGGPPPPPSPLDSLVLKGLITMGGTTVVTLFNTADNKSVHVPLGTTVAGLTVSDYRSSDESVLVQSGGKERRVKFKKAEIVAMVVPPPAPPNAPPPGVPVAAGAPPSPGQPGAMGDEEVRKRMENVAQEIRRRREMRREIMERQAQGQQGQQ